MSKPYVIYKDKDIERIRLAAQATAYVRDELAIRACAGMSTYDLDQLAGALIAETGGKSGFLGYGGFPGNICISVNEEVVHGIGRKERILTEDDIVSIDVGVVIDGANGDSALTFPLKKDVPEVVQGLLDHTKESLFAGIEAAICGNFVSDISKAVQKVANKYKLGIVRDFVGHGCGLKLHEPPEVPNYNTGSRGVKLQTGMVLAIEPMMNLGTEKVVVDKIDRWTVRTKDKSLSAHFEHMVLITENKPEILTWQKMT